MKFWPLILLLSLTSFSCGRSELRAVTFKFNERIGWLHGPCLAIADANLKAGTPVTLVVMGEPPKILNAAVQESTASAATCPALAEERAAMSKPGNTFYSLQGRTIGLTEMALAIIGSPAMPTVENGVAKVDLNQDGHSEIFTSCASSEGINFYVWTDEPYRGEPQWTKYYYLGYDLVANCP